jgi:molybdate transport system regulatory protein
LLLRYALLYITKVKHKSKLNTKAGNDSSYHFCGHIWIDGPEGTFIGYGRVILLERIREHGSITKAAKSMDMSYRHAWELIDSMNRQAPAPFIETSTGGKGGGGTRLTGEGEQAITMFWDFHRHFQDFLVQEEKKILVYDDKKNMLGGSHEA